MLAILSLERPHFGAKRESWMHITRNALFLASPTHGARCGQSGSKFAHYNAASVHTVDARSSHGQAEHCIEPPLPASASTLVVAGLNELAVNTSAQTVALTFIRSVSRAIGWLRTLRPLKMRSSWAEVRAARARLMPDTAAVTIRRRFFSLGQDIISASLALNLRAFAIHHELFIVYYLLATPTQP